MKRTVQCFCALFLLVFCAVPLYAQTQNVKISGSVETLAIARSHLYGSGSYEADNDTNNNFFLALVGVEIDAELTDNVQTVVRLANQRDWNSSSSTANEFDVGIDLAYVVLKEMIYAPLTLTIGRQDLVFGNTFIIGANYVDPNSTISADEYTQFKSFDALRATLDLAPWTVDLVYAKIDENSIQNMNDIDLYGANAGHRFDVYDAETEAYYWYYHDSSIAAAGSPKVDEANTIHTVGLRGSFVPVDNLTLSAEGAYQFGRYVTNSSTENRKRRAWAANAIAEYVWAERSWTPTLGGQYVFFSGNDVDTTSGTYKGWNSLYRDTTYGDIHEWMGTFYLTQAYASGEDAVEGNNANRHVFNVYASVSPVESVTLDAKYYHFRLDKKISTTNTSKDLGDEIDVSVNWAYTDDVSFFLLGSVFWPGRTYPSGQDDTARQVIAKTTVQF